MYTRLGTRPNFSFAMSLISRFQSNPGMEHWKAIKRALRYLKGTVNYALTYKGGSDIHIQGYSNANYLGDLDESKSTSGYIFMLSGGVVSWCSKKHDIVALSIMESEYVACYFATKEAI
ncbi:hypothetical protein AMTRI_Chr06g201690 [Amborella trichopoda]